MTLLVLPKPARTHHACNFQEEDRKELSLRAIIGLSPEQQDQMVGAAGQAEGQYQQAGHAAAGKAEQGADAATAQVSPQALPLACWLCFCPGGPFAGSCVVDITLPISRMAFLSICVMPAGRGAKL